MNGENVKINILDKMDMSCIVEEKREDVESSLPVSDTSMLENDIEAKAEYEETSIHVSNATIVDDSLTATNGPVEVEKVSCCNSTIIFCGVTVTAIAFIVGTILYYVFGILYLVQDFEKFNDCKSSKLWIYVLITMIFSFFNLHSNVKKDEVNNLVYFVHFLFNAGLCIFGGIELFGDKLCANLEDSNLWTFALVSFSLQIFAAFMFCMFFVFSTVE